MFRPYTCGRIGRLPAGGQGSSEFHEVLSCRYLGRPVRSVTDSFKVGDVVRFDAEQNGRKEIKARWRVLAFHHVKGVPGWASPKPCKYVNNQAGRTRHCAL